jgi:urease gamma subunit
MMLEGGPPPEPTIEEEIFGDMVGELSALDKVLQKMPSTAVSVTANTLIAASAVLAWLITPSRVPALVTVSVASVASKRVGDRLKQRRRETVPAAIAEMILQSGIKDLSLVKVEELARRLNVPPDEFEAQLRKIYGEFLQAVAEDEDVTSAQVSKLAALRRNLGLKWNVTEAVHVSKARDFIGSGAAPAAAARPSRRRTTDSWCA